MMVYTSAIHTSLLFFGCCSHYRSKNQRPLQPSHHTTIIIMSSWSQSSPTSCPAGNLEVCHIPVHSVHVKVPTGPSKCQRLKKKKPVEIRAHALLNCSVLQSVRTDYKTVLSLSAVGARRLLCDICREFGRVQTH
ncbi:hypothetical protein GOODEAATRI_030584 [Goodea atripinnis]|uniref:Secreted protein n=1 Tax=Goodea atripinnis TaxID=208336 RepID=A0ABV0Q2C7_9TELE